MVAMLGKFVCFVFPFLSLCKNAYGTSIRYTNCGPNTIESIDLAPCPVQPCSFAKGSTGTVTIDFTTTFKVTSIEAKVYGIIAGVPVPYQLPKSDGCQGCNLECPMSPGQYRYINELPVLQSYPDIRLPVKWELVDQDNNLLVCFVFPMEITG